MGKLEAFEVGGVPSLDITVGRAGPAGFDADGDKPLGFGGNFEGVTHDGMKGFRIPDQLVGRENHHGGFRVPRRNQADSKGDSRSGVPSGWLCEDIPGG